MAYYVSAVDRRNRVLTLAGPFRTHGEALAQVSPASMWIRSHSADYSDLRDAAWWMYGTHRDPAGHQRVGKINEQLGCIPTSGGYVARIPKEN